MKVYLAALATVAALSAAAPAYAAYTKEAPRLQAQHEQMSFPQTSQLSTHCQQVLARPDTWGQKEVEFCQGSVD